MDRCIEKDRKKSQKQPSLHPPKSNELGPTTCAKGRSLDLFLARNAEKLGTRVYDLVRLHWLGVVNFHLFLFILGSLSAPCLSHWGQGWMAKYIYAFYGISCHQIPSRSFFVFDHQMALCARCFSFFALMLAFGLLLSLKNVRPLNGKTAFLLTLPFLIDVSLQALGIKESTNLLRVMTTVPLSLSVSLFLYPRIRISIERFSQDSKQFFR